MANGGTNAATPTTARANLGAAASGVNSDITELTGITVPLSIAQGGTGGNSLAALIALVPIQGGAAILAGGTQSVVAGITITAQSVILFSLKIPGGTRTGFAGYKLTGVVNGGPGVGAFTVTAINDSAATLGACTDTVNYFILF